MLNSDQPTQKHLIKCLKKIFKISYNKNTKLILPNSLSNFGHSRVVNSATASSNYLLTLWRSLLRHQSRFHCSLGTCLRLFLQQPCPRHWTESNTPFFHMGFKCKTCPSLSLSMYWLLFPSHQKLSFNKASRIDMQPWSQRQCKDCEYPFWFSTHFHKCRIPRARDWITSKAYDW